MLVTLNVCLMQLMQNKFRKRNVVSLPSISVIFHDIKFYCRITLKCRERYIRYHWTCLWINWRECKSSKYWAVRTAVKRYWTISMRCSAPEYVWILLAKVSTRITKHLSLKKHLYHNVRLVRYGMIIRGVHCLCAWK